MVGKEMCGIVGFVGDEPAGPVVLRAISRLEYRGYDSAGMVSVSSGRIYFQKDVGSIADVQRKHKLDQLPGEIALAHVRWATHGRVNQVNFDEYEVLLQHGWQRTHLIFSFEAIDYA